MARVPIPAGNLVDRRPATDAKLIAGNSGGGTLAGLAEGLQKAGAAGADYAQTQDRIDTQFDEAGAKTLDNKFVTAVQPLRSTFLSQKGFAAGTAKPETLKALNTLYDDTIKEAKTPRMKAMLTDVLQSRRVSLMGEIDNHTIQQIGAASEAASLARINLAGEEAAATTDPVARQKAIATGLGEIAVRAQQQGMPAEWTKTEGFKFESGVHRSIATQMIGNDDIDGALQYVDANKDRLNDADEQAVRSMLHAPLQRRETNTYVDGIMGSGTGGDTPSTFSYSDPLHGAGRTPVPGGQFNAKRDYGGHQGIDIPAAQGTPIFAAAPGIVKISHSPLGGNIVTVDHGDGKVTRYMHLGSVAVKDGDKVTPDTQLGGVGMTGRTSGPHLHYEVRENGKPIDPNAAIASVQQSPQRHDLNALLGRIDQDTSLTPEQRDRYKTEVERRVGRDEQLQSRVEDQAQRDALDAITKLGPKGFTDVSQLPASVRGRLSSADQLRFMDMAATNAKSLATDAKVKANGPEAFNLNMMAIYQPDAFKALNLGMFQDKVSPSELEQFAALQGKMRTAAPLTTDHSRIWGQINRIAPDLGFDLGSKGGKPNKPADRQRAMQLFSTVQADLNAQMDGKRQPTDDEVKRSLDHAVRMVVRDGDRDHPIRAYEVGGPAAGVPASVRDRIVNTWRARYRAQPSEGQIASEYQRYRGQAGFWK